MDDHPVDSIYIGFHDNYFVYSGSTLLGKTESNRSSIIIPNER